MAGNDREGIIREFRNSPSEFISFLIQNKLLAGDIRKILCEEILETPESPASKMASYLPFMPNIVSLVSTDGCCNLACRMCGGSKGKLEYISKEKLALILKHIPTTELLTFVAGNSEPLMNPDFKENLKILADHFVNYSLVTNGHLLKDDIIEALVNYPLNGDFNVSLDAVKAETYRNIRGTSIDKVMENLQKLHKVRLKSGRNNMFVSLLMVGMEDNIAELPDFIKLASELGAYRVKVDSMEGSFKPGNFTENPKWRSYIEESIRIADELKINLIIPAEARPIVKTAENSGTKEQKAGKETLRCPSFNSLHININGDIHPCCHTMQVKLGNIFSAPLYSNSKYINARKSNAEGRIFSACKTVKNCSLVNQLSDSGETERRLI